MKDSHGLKNANELDPALARELLAMLQEVRQLDGALIKTNEHSHWTTRSYSAGKPWFDYETVLPDMLHAERRRVRVAERWFKDAGGDRPHGTVTILEQFIFARRTTVFDEDWVQDKRVYEGENDEKVVVVSKLGFLATGSVRGKQIKRFDTFLPYDGGYAEEYAEAVERFQLQKPFFEEDYRSGVLQNDDVIALHNSIGDFVAIETGLASLRSAISIL